MNLSRFHITWSFFICASTCAMESQQLARLMPHADYVPKIDDCPLIPLIVALESTTFNKCYNDFKNAISTKDTISTEDTTFEFCTNSDIPTTWHFAHCLTKIHKINRETSKSQKNDFENKLLNLYLESFSDEELTDLLNIANPTECIPLQDKLAAIITARTIALKNTVLLKKLDLDARKQIASKISIESKLLQSYSDSLHETQIFYQNSLFQHIKQKIFNSNPFTKHNHTQTHYINTETGTIITSNYYIDDTVKQTTHINIIKTNQPEIIIDCRHLSFNWGHGIIITSNADESLFIVEFPHFYSYEKGRKCIINYEDPSLIIGDPDYCFTHNSPTNCNTIYCVDANNTISIKEIYNHTTKNFPLNWNKNICLGDIPQNQHIYGITVNQDGNAIAINVSNKIFIGTRIDCNTPFVFTSLTPPSLNGALWYGWKHNITLNNEGNKLFIVDKKADYIIIADICAKTFYSIPFLSSNKDHLRHTPLLIQNGNILIIPTIKHCIFLHTETKQYWFIKKNHSRLGHTHNHEKMIQEKVEHSHNSLNNEKRTTEIVTLINDNIKKIIDIFHKNTVPLIYYTITLNPPGFLTLGDDDYYSYHNLTQEEQAVIDASYTITSTSRLSYNYALGKKICKKIAGPVLILAGLVGYLVIYIKLHDKYPEIFKHMNTCLSAIGKAIKLLW